MNDVLLNWLGEIPKISIATTFGVPWKRGELKRDELLSLLDDQGNVIPSQQRITAYWNDGSVKWTAHSAYIENITNQYKLIKGAAKQYENLASDTNDMILIDTGVIKCQLPKQSFDSIIINQTHIKLICTTGTAKYNGVIERAYIEQNGSAHCVITLEGNHKSGLHEWLPFKLRLYFHKNSLSVRMVHTFMFNGDANKDFITGIGVVFEVASPKKELFNRHIRLSGDKGFFIDSPKSIATRRTKGKYVDILKKQLNGEVVSINEFDTDFLHAFDDNAIWNDFRLVQNSSNSYFIYKRTQPECCYLKAYEGRRSNGFVYFDGIGVGMRDFWKKYPRALEINNASKEKSEIAAWFWKGEAMDMRHYDTVTHVASAYEGAEELRSTPYGIANTNELTLWCLDKTPTNDMLKNLENQSTDPAMLICEPEYYQHAQAFGNWSLVGIPGFEGTQEAGIQFIKEQIEQNRWYGFWNYGDIMRFYDPTRHMWKYDLGGCAWNNSEIVPNMWLWYSFLRSGRHDIFRLAESFTRHASEVDQYHFGDYKGLGSRHNVVHWGCGCKEARVSMAGLHRFYYYLTGDDRTGEILDEVADADFSLLNIDPLREIVPKDQYPTHARSSPDWAAFTSNWMTKWERYEDQKYKEKIQIGINCLKNMPYRLCSGPLFGYDPNTSMLYYMGDENRSFHMVNCFGALPVWLELSIMLEDEEWKEMLADYGEFYLLPLEEKQARRKDIVNNRLYGLQDSVLVASAFAAWFMKDKILAQKVRNMLSKYPDFEENYVNILDIPSPVKEFNIFDSGIGFSLLNTIIGDFYLSKLTRKS